MQKFFYKLTIIVFLLSCNKENKIEPIKVVINKPYTVRFNPNVYANGGYYITPDSIKEGDVWLECFRVSYETPYKINEYYYMGICYHRKGACNIFYNRPGAIVDLYNQKDSSIIGENIFPMEVPTI